ncbi:E3 ubiquitin-protein ligase PPP1R11-like [Dysidea avara]|uniref:E3 ubiquitin-protein ligase PPP1R11-like n=1 Tax=Dysidea avara TaxID=196820 RepID=UPI0033213CA5
MACSTMNSESVSLTDTQQTSNEQTLLVTLHKPKTDKVVHWDEEVVDNEHMGKKASKCCCIYHKPQNFGDSSSSSDDSDNTDSDKCGCHEHRVARKRFKKKPHDNNK